MKVKHLFSAGLAGAIVLITSNAMAQWRTVDVFTNGGKMAVNSGLTVDIGGDLYACGTGSGLNPIGKGPSYHGFLRASADGGNTWALLDDFLYPGLDMTTYFGITSDPAGNLYTIGRAWMNGATLPGHWVVQRSLDGGATWSVVDDFIPGGFQPYPTPHGIATDQDGNVYVVGDADYNTADGYWTVRKGIGGANFTTVDSVVGSSLDTASAVYIHPTAGIFVVGEGALVVTNKNKTTSTYGAWVVRRSTDAGATWKTVDTYQSVLGQESCAYAVGADALGNVYVAGRARVISGNLSSYHWVVRKSANGGNSWTTVDSYQPSASVSSEAHGFAVDSAGNLFVAGNAGNWIVRENPGGTGTWQTVDSVAGATAAAIAANASGNVFVGGFATGSGPNRWVVRKH